MTQSQDIPLRTQTAIKKDMFTTIKKLEYSRHTWQIWQDFTEIAAITISNQMVYFDQELEDKYLSIVKNYEAKELIHFQHMLKLCFEALQNEKSDFLGQVFMELDLGSHWQGQFFTPYCVCEMMAKLTFDLKLFDEKETVTVNEPTCGAGAMVIALCEHIDESEINYAHRLHIVAQDLDFTAVCMCYIQLSIIGASAHVIHGNTLNMECRQKLITPAAMLYGRY